MLLLRESSFLFRLRYEKLHIRNKTDHFPGEGEKVQRKVMDRRIANESEMPRTLVVSLISSTRTRNEQLSRQTKRNQVKTAETWRRNRCIRFRNDSFLDKRGKDDNEK